MREVEGPATAFEKSGFIALGTVDDEDEDDEDDGGCCSVRS